MSPRESLDFGVLAAYWLGELDAAEEAAVEEQLFEDPAAEARLASIVALGEGLARLARAGRLHGALTLQAVAKLRAAGLRVREYTLTPGQVVPCTIADEDLMVIRLRGTFESAPEVDIDLEWRLGGDPPRVEPHRAIPVDTAGKEVVLAYAGDAIRALPRAGFTYRVASRDGTRLGDFHLDHTPPAV